MVELNARPDDETMQMGSLARRAGATSSTDRWRQGHGKLALIVKTRGLRASSLVHVSTGTTMPGPRRLTPILVCSPQPDIGADAPLCSHPDRTVELSRSDAGGRAVTMRRRLAELVDRRSSAAGMGPRPCDPEDERLIDREMIRLLASRSHRA